MTHSHMLSSRLLPEPQKTAAEPGREWHSSLGAKVLSGGRAMHFSGRGVTFQSHFCLRKLLTK